MFSYHEYLWQPVGQSDETSSLLPDEATNMSFEERRSICLLVCSTIGNEQLREMFVGMLLPPPYLADHNTLVDHLFTRSEVQAAALTLPLAWRKMVLLMPLNLALTTGVYDARLRAAMRRLSHLFELPWNVVAQHEAALMCVDVSVLHRKEAEARQQAIHEKKEGRKYSAKRIASIGAFTVVGGVAFVVTGGLAAPLVGPAFAALCSATATTAGVIGSAGGALLSGTALAAGFASAIGAATQGAALSALVVPALSATNVTAILGLGGAGLAGYKGARRTGNTHGVALRSIHDLEELPPLVLEAEEITDLCERQRPVHSAEGGNGEKPPPAPIPEKNKNEGSCKLQLLLGSEGRIAEKIAEVRLHMAIKARELQSDLAEGGDDLKGIVVPAHLRSITLTNLANSVAAKKRRIANVFAIENRLGVKIHLRAAKVVFGKWLHVAPRMVDHDFAGLSVTQNKRARPTGAGCIVCYEPEMPRSGAGADGARLARLKFWFLSQTTILGTSYLSVVAERPQPNPMDPNSIAAELERTAIKAPDCFTVDDLVIVEVRFFPKPIFVLRLKPIVDPRSGSRLTPSSSSSTTMELAELDQSVADLSKLVEQRRRLFVLVKNKTTKWTIRTRSLRVTSGAPTPLAQVADEVPPQRGARFALTNGSFSIGGAGGTWLFAVEPAEGDGTAGASFFCSVHVDVAALGSKVSCGGGVSDNIALCRALNVDLSSEWTSKVPLILQQSPTAGPATERDDQLSAAAPSQQQKPEQLLVVRLYASQGEVGSVTVELLDDHPGDRALKGESKMAITIGITGFIATLDPRRSSADQQVAIWQPILRDHPLLCDGDGFVLEWEDELQRELSDSVGLELDESALGVATGRATGMVKAQVKQELYRGAVFAGVKALEAVQGAFAAPLYARWAADAIDNAFGTLQCRSVSCGQELAAALLNPDLRGNRPATLVGYSFGSLVIAECLRALAEVEAFGIVENVYLLGATCSASKEDFILMRKVVAGRFVNVFNRSDWLLSLLHKTNTTDMLIPLAGLTAVHVAGIENIDASAVVDSHASYASHLSRVLDLIPVYPSPQSLDLAGQPLAPGAAVSPGERLRATERITKAMSSKDAMLTATICVTNRLESPRGTTLVLVGSHLFGCSYDFAAPPAVSPGRSAVCGLAAASLVPHIAGTVAFGFVVDEDISPDQPAANAKRRTMALLLVRFHRTTSSGRVLGNAVVHFVNDEVVANDGDVHKRLVDFLEPLVQEYSSGFDAVASSASVASDSDLSHLFTAPVAAYADAAGEKPGRSVIVNVNRSEPNAVFVEVQWKHDERVEGLVSATAPPGDDDDDATALVSMDLPCAVAAVRPLEELHGEVMRFTEGLAARSQALAGALHMSNASIMSRAMSVSMTMGSRFQRSVLQPIVIANCSDDPLLFCDVASAGDHIAGAVDDSVVWRRLPPPVIPPQSFALLLLQWRLPSESESAADADNSATKLLSFFAFQRGDATETLYVAIHGRTDANDIHEEDDATAAAIWSGQHLIDVSCAVDSSNSHLSWSEGSAQEKAVGEAGGAEWSATCVPCDAKLINDTRVLMLLVPATRQQKAPRDVTPDRPHLWSFFPRTNV